MCGIVGIYLKSKKFEKDLGKMLSGMLINMESRGPDSAGFAIYKKEKKEEVKYSICINNLSFEKFKKGIAGKIKFTKILKNSDHVVLSSKEKLKRVLNILNEFKGVSLVGYGKSIEILSKLEILKM